MLVSTAGVAVEGVAGRGAEFWRVTKVKWRSSSSSRSSLGRNERAGDSGSCVSSQQAIPSEEISVAVEPYLYIRYRPEVLRVGPPNKARRRICIRGGGQEDFSASIRDGNG